MEKIAASIAQIAAEAVAKAAAESRTVTVSLSPEVIAGLSAWIADQPEPRPAVPQAIGQGLADWLRVQGYLPPGSGRSPDA